MATSNMNSGDSSDSSSINKTPLFNIASNVVAFLKDFVVSIVKDIAPQAYVAEVVGINEDSNGNKRYDLRIVSDPDSAIIHGIVNNTPYTLQTGDYVEILSTQNNLSVSYITNKFQAPLSTNNELEGYSEDNNSNIDNKLEVKDQGADTYSYLETSDGKLFLIQDSPSGDDE